MTEPKLEQLVDVLSRGHFMTAARIMHKVRCTKPTVYARVSALENLGLPVVKRLVREGAAGPLSTAYAISPAVRKVTL